MYIIPIACPLESAAAIKAIPNGTIEKIKLFEITIPNYYYRDYAYTTWYGCLLFLGRTL